MTAMLMCVVLASAVSAEVEGDFTYMVLNGQATITAASTDIAGDVVIPETLGGYPVTAIGSGAFAGRVNMTSLTIPDGVVSIGEEAFYSCTGMKTVSLSDNLKTIGKSAFDNCSSLSDLIIPENVTTISEWAFSSCKNLIDIYIPANVSSLNATAFGMCLNLTSITVSIDNISYSSQDGILYNKDMTTLIIYPAGKTNPTCIIPDSVLHIGDYAFYKCYNITDISIPLSVVSIGNLAFYYCKELKNLQLPKNMISIGSHAFSYCKKLSVVTLPDSISHIGSYVFSYCENLTHISLPKSLTYISSYAFRECKNLTSFTVSNNITSIEKGAFYCCNNLTSILIPNTVISIGDRAFAISEYLTIYGYSGSYAELFAKNEGIPFIALDEAAVPQFTTNLTSAEYSTGDTAVLSVTASTADNGSLTYQWYVSDTPDGDGTAIDGATEASYTAPTDTAGVKYYYVIVTNTSETETGVKTATARSNTAAVTVISKIDAEVPVIFAQTHSSACHAGDDTALFVSASVSDGGALSYQWYVSDVPGGDGDAIEGAVSAGYKPQTDEDGVKYYYVIITNTNPSATGAQSTSVRSEEMALTVGGGYITGDVDASGLTDSDDAAVLAQYFAGRNLSNPDAADIDSDQALTRRDAMVLTRYLSGWKEYNTLIRYSVYE